MKNEDDLDRELREELESHVRMRAEHDGTDRFDARRKLGNVLQMQEEMRAMHIPARIDEAIQDLRYALRRAARNPGFTLAVIAALAIGIGSSAAVFSVVDRILFRPLPFVQEEQLVWVGMTAPLFGEEFLLAGDYLDWKERQTSFSHFTASQGVEDCDATEDNPVRFSCLPAAHDYLQTFGITLALGRQLQPNDKEHLLISHALWQQRFGGSPDVLQRTLTLNGRVWRIAGVLPPEFEIPSLAPVDIMLPLGIDEAAERSRKGRMTFLKGWARLKPGVSIPQAEESLKPVFQYSLQFVPPSFVKEVKLKVAGLRERQTQNARRISLALLAAVLCVLLIACANVANLLLARASANDREAAIREAIGASRSRLIRQNLTESMLLALAGGVIGVALGWAMLRIAISLAPTAIPRLREATLDARVLGFSLLLTVICGLVSGAAVAFRRPTETLLSGGSRTTHGSHRFLRPALVTIQIALASALLYSAALLGESFLRMQQESLGFDSSNLLGTTISLRDSVYSQPAAREAFWRNVEDRLSALPGAAAVAMADSMPPMGRAAVTIYSRIRVDGNAEDLRGGTGGMVVFRSVTPNYFNVLGIRLLHGRSYTEADRNSPEAPMILSGTLARKLFASPAAAIGHTLQPGPGVAASTIIGVVTDVRNNGLDRQDPEFYLPFNAKTGRANLSVIVRTAAPQLTQELLRAQLASLDPHIPLTFETMDQRTGKLTAGARFNASVLGLFSITGLLLGATGIFSVVSFLVSRRTREIGVRVALGATSNDIRSMVLRGALLWSVSGCLAGAAVIAALLPQLRELTYQSKLGSPWAALGVLIAMSLLSILSALGPALRAARLDPARTLRAE